MDIPSDVANYFSKIFSKNISDAESEYAQTSFISIPEFMEEADFAITDTRVSILNSIAFVISKEFSAEIYKGSTNEEPLYRKDVLIEAYTRCQNDNLFPSALSPAQVEDLLRTLLDSLNDEKLSDVPFIVRLTALAKITDTYSANTIYTKDSDFRKVKDYLLQQTQIAPTNPLKENNNES